MTATSSTAAQRVLIVGATSGIARAIAHRLAADGAALVLAGRNTDAIEQDAADLRIRHKADVEVRRFEALAYDQHPALLDGLDLTAAIVCHGVLISNDQAIASPQDHRRMIEVNYSSTVSVLELLATYFEAKGSGAIAALSSVAGDRGRSTNYCYGTTKAALTAYLSGLRGRLHAKGITVLTVKPGPTDTPMVQGLEVKGKAASPDLVAKQIVADLRRGASVCYTPRKWWLIMRIIAAIPEWLFKRLTI